MDKHCERPIWFELHNFHRAFDRSAAPLVESSNSRANADGSVRIHPQLDIGIPAGVIANMLHCEELEHLVKWSVHYF